jgi:hypothetical protein
VGFRFEPLEVRSLAIGYLVQDLHEFQVTALLATKIDGLRELE